MLDRERVLAAFDRVLRELNAGGPKGLRPRAVALRAHRLYCAGLGPEEKQPSPQTFRKFTTGRLALPEVVHSLRSADIRSTERARLDRKRLRRAFQKAVKTLKGRAKPSLIARRAHEIYLHEADGLTPRPSQHTFQRLIYGKVADPEIVALLEPALKWRDRQIALLKMAPVPSAKRARLDRERLRIVFQKAVCSLETDFIAGRAKLRHVARQARVIYLREADGRAPEPSLPTFERLLYGKGADAEIRMLLKPALAKRAQEVERANAARAAKAPSAKRIRLDRELLRIVFQKAVCSLETDFIAGRAKLRHVARHALALYLRESDGKAPEPSLPTFERLLYGKGADTEIRMLLKPALAKRAQEVERANAARAAKAPSLKRVRLNRERLRRVFQEAARRLEANVLRGQGRGQVRPLQVARRAYALYNLEADQESSRPSPHTFHRLIYGKGADPEIMTLIQTALKGKG